MLLLCLNLPSSVILLAFCTRWLLSHHGQACGEVLVSTGLLDSRPISFLLCRQADVDLELTHNVHRLCTDLAEVVPTVVKPVVAITRLTWLV